MTIPTNSLGGVLAIVVFIICVILILLILVGAGAALPAWVVLALLATLAIARLC